MNSGAHANTQSRGILGSFVSLVTMVAFVVVCSWALRTFVFQPYEIPTGSMETTIMSGDMVFSEKITYYARDPQPGDIVTFGDPVIPGRTLIKRVIAVGGQTVDINDQDGLVYVDGAPLDEPYTNATLTYSLPGGVSYPYTIPEGHLWTMGDNRANSQDSRHYGAVPESSVTGKAVFVYWPISNIGMLE